ncbi:MAG: dockerin type I repeat-containing protein, partial [Muribaculaceae bacterium]|nr:dockerin type I repeat-containing protein [Muribaculaceae bacterium]
FAIPTANGTLYSDQYVTVERQEAAVSYTIEISTSATTWGRTRFVETVRDFAYHTTQLAGDIKVNNKLMEDGKTYYARARASYNTPNGAANTDYSTPIAFVYSSGNAPIPGDVNGDGIVSSVDVTALYNFLLNNDSSAIVNGDLDGDGVITAGDIVIVYNILLGN